MAQATPNILVVEDDRETRALIAKYLRSNSCNVTTAGDGREMARAMTDHRVDLLILDVMLPGEDGLSLCRKVRAQSQTPIIMLTARGDDVDRIMGLEMGADDYLPKPFNPRELLARINAVLRRQAAARNASALEGTTALCFQGWRSAEFDLLRIFCERPGRVLSRDSLLDLTQGRNSGSFERSIDVLADLDQMRSMLEQVLSFLRDGRKLAPPTLSDIATTLQIIADQFADMGHGVTYEGPAHVLAVVRPDDLQRGITNLVENAVRFGGETTISLSATNERITIDIEDDGPGISDADKRNVLKPFVRGDGARNMDDAAGFGLGLSIARAIIRAWRRAVAARQRAAWPRCSY